MILQMITVLVNVILAPVLIVGWGTGKPMGTAGAGLASTISVVVGVILSAYYFHKHEKYVSVHREQMKPQMAVWGRLLHIGLPVGLEFFLMSVAMAIIYWLIRDFGAAAQAGFGVGQGVMRIIMLPAMAVAFGPDRPAAVCRELTKTYEEVKRGTLGDLARWAADGVRGEITVVVGGAPLEVSDPETAVAAIQARVAAGERLKDVCAEVAAATGLSRNDLYNAALAARR